MRLIFTLPLGGPVSFGGTLVVELDVQASCDPLGTSECDASQACYPLTGATPRIALCANPGTAAHGEPCRFANSCLPGLVCIGATAMDATCRQICDVEADDCPGAGLCTPLDVGTAGHCP